MSSEEERMDSPPCSDQQYHHLQTGHGAWVLLLRDCSKRKDLHSGIRVHAAIVKCGLLHLSSYALVSMYANCSMPAKAHDLLLCLCVQDVVSWTEVITGYVQQGHDEEAVDCFECMQQEGLSPNAITFSCILKAYGCIGDIARGVQIHEEIIRLGLLEKDAVLGSALVDMYAKMGALAKARQVLKELPARDVFTWTALITGYAQEELGEEALDCFTQMQSEGVSPSVVTFASILNACGSARAVHKGEQIHGEIFRQGLLGRNAVLGGALVDMYAKCGALAKAQQVLEELSTQTVVSWSALIGGYLQKGQGEKALDCLERMQSKGIAPNAVTFASALKACASLGAGDKGEQIHDEVMQRGILTKDIVLSNALIDMYAKCGILSKAKRVLEELPAQDVISWSSLIAGYVQDGQGNEALECFEQMQSKGFTPNAVTFACILRACGSVGDFRKGTQIHDEIAKQGLLKDNVVLGSALLDMYIKCGALAKAQQVLEELPVQDVIAWTTLIAGYARQGQVLETFNCFEQMLCKGFSPSVITFSCLLYACSHSGLVDEGQIYFDNMRANYGVIASEEHYTCMADLFGRAGHLTRAIALSEKLPLSKYSAVWPSLLSACRKSGDLHTGIRAFEHALQGDKADAAAFVLMANIYEAARIQEEEGGSGGAGQAI